MNVLKIKKCLLKVSKQKFQFSTKNILFKITSQDLCSTDWMPSKSPCKDSTDILETLLWWCDNVADHGFLCQKYLVGGIGTKYPFSGEFLYFNQNCPRAFPECQNLEVTKTFWLREGNSTTFRTKVLSNNF